MQTGQPRHSPLPGRPGHSLGRAGTLVIAALALTLTVAPSLSIAAATGASSSSSLHVPLALPRPVDRPGGPGPTSTGALGDFSPQAATPYAASGCGDCAYYMQEGAFLDQACFANVTGSCTAFSGYSSLYVDVQVETSPYYTGFELNAVSNTGDWYQSMVGYNWCADGFEVMNEVWNAAEESISGPCVTSSLAISAGDEVELGLYVASSGDVCFTAQDLTHPQTAFLNCVSQPDPGSTPSTNYFAYGANGGYFTGPMTEIVDPSATSCESYTDMPVVNYQFVAGAYVVDFTPWSDEWYPPTDGLCYDSIGSTEFSQTPGDTSLQFVDASGGSTYGPHWQSAQNISSLSMLGWWGFTTDAKLPTPTATPASIEEGQAVDVQFADPVVVEHVDSNPTYADWSESLPGTWTCTPSDSDELYTCQGTATAAGTYPIQLVIGETGGHSLSSPVLDYQVFSGLTIVSAGALPTSVDVGQTLLLTVDLDQSSSGVTFVWAGLPTGCTSVSTDALDCSPTAPGSFSVTVTATDSSGGSVTSGAIAVTVDSDPAVTEPVASPGATGTDVGLSVTFQTQVSGGAGGYAYNWSGLPATCTGTDLATVSCLSSDTGSFAVTVTVTDANHFAQAGPTLNYTIYPRPTILSFASSQSTVLAGSPTTLRVVTAGGTPPLSYAYTGLPTGCASSSTANLRCSPSSTGTFLVGVNVTDASGVSAWSNLTLVVHASFLGLPQAEGELLLVAVLGAVIAAAVAVVVAASRRRRAPPTQ